MAQGKLFVPTEDQRRMVEAMAGYGVPFAQISALIGDNGIDEDTLNKHFKNELVQGKAKANSKVGKTLFEKATKDGGDTAAMIWWSKTQMGWKSAENESYGGGITVTIKDETKSGMTIDSNVEIE